jgi:hypothetical protein
MPGDAIIARSGEAYLAAIEPNSPPKCGQSEERDHEDHAPHRHRGSEFRQYRLGYAGQGTAANTVVAWLPGVVEQAPAQHARRSRRHRTGRRCCYATQSNHGTWLYQPNQGGDGTSS